jgi:hypothetical protein
MRTMPSRRWIVASAMSIVALVTVSAYLLGRARAAGAPTAQPLTYSGILTDTAGTALTGSKNIQITLWDTAVAGTMQCSAGPTATMLSSGAFQVVLPAACTTAIHANGDLWVEVFVDGTSLGRTKLGAVPYAVEADHAVRADQSASDFSVPGTLTAANATVSGSLIRKIARAHALGPNDDTDNGAIASRTLTFAKTQAATGIRVSYTDNFRVATGAADGACRWEILFNGAPCAMPGRLIYDQYSLPNFNQHRPQAVNGTCFGIAAGGLAAGSYNVQISVSTAPGYVAANSNCYTGWNASYWSIEAEEVF